eukprot:TRINITY_DN84833_c0_g1_i1.p1 TRINITY_DN84833_c0_g1~~TRINITY_DN84833_c0_g1_i1.p1  ORF type:complete len:100 (+),score=2.47 TRINITY_DN84833_c0_g1_i1:182-481(+)
MPWDIPYITPSLHGCRTTNLEVSLSHEGRRCLQDFEWYGPRAFLGQSLEKSCNGFWPPQLSADSYGFLSPVALARDLVSFTRRSSLRQTIRLGYPAALH